MKATTSPCLLRSRPTCAHTSGYPRIRGPNVDPKERALITGTPTKRTHNSQKLPKSPYDHISSKPAYYQSQTPSKEPYNSPKRHPIYRNSHVGRLEGWGGLGHQAVINFHLDPRSAENNGRYPQIMGIWSSFWVPWRFRQQLPSSLTKPPLATLNGMANDTQTIPVGSYHVLLGYPTLGLGIYNHKVECLKKRGMV